ncbi:MAG: tRNA (adenosine(37)-N6)-dimethylallyltransferase MiaA [Ignavibacteriales bacterium]|nr:tRNA (adenosine(37)-N6)-dimethylallyltransferase MiaA [Ignavibacteriales bacterium]
MKKILALVGPTAAGKTRLSLILATRLHAEIVSADSRQIYRYLTIGTSKPSDEDRRAVPHHFIDTHDPSDLYSAGLYGREARNAIHEIIRRGKTPIIVGGSGLYIRALVDGLFEGPGANEEIRKYLELRLKTEGIGQLIRDLEHVDPDTAGRMRVEPKARRIIRALEVYYSTGVSLSRHHTKQNRTQDLNVLQVGLEWDRQLLYRRINERVLQMIRSGLEDEARWLLERYDRRLNALNTVGYKEMFDFIQGKKDLESTVSLMKQNTRRFAKRQVTWFRSDRRIRWIALNEERDWEEVAERVLRLLQKEG